MSLQSPEDAIPWVGLYTALASFLCLLAMAADLARGFWQWKLWFPNRFFTLNAATLTLIAIAMKLPVDLTTKMSTIEVSTSKNCSISFLITMIANFLPSLGLMNDKELLMNIVALEILVVTVIVNILIQTYTDALFVPFIPVLIFPILWPFSVAMATSTFRKKLEHQYNESQRLVSCRQEKKFSYKQLRSYVKKYWMMVESCDPQLVIAYSPISSACGDICLGLAIISGLFLVSFLSTKKDEFFGTSDYKWSIKVIIFVQSIGVALGSIAPLFRFFTSNGNYIFSKKWSKDELNVFLVEKHWVQRLRQWKHNHIHSHILGRECNIVLHILKNIFLNLCIALHITVLVICKIICLVPRIFLILLSYCWYFFKSFLNMFKKVANVSNTSNASSEIEEYRRYVVQIEDEAKLSKSILRNMFHSISRLLKEYEEKEPRKLMKLLEKSTGFSGVLEFDNAKVPPLCPEETHNCWSLILVTLTASAMALPNIGNDHFKGLLSGMRESLQLVRHVEECLNVDDDLVNARKASRHAWTEVEVYGTWQRIDLQKKARKGKTSKEVLKWLGHEAAKNVIQFKSNKNTSTYHLVNKFIPASSMYRISETVLLYCNEKENWPHDEELFEWISTIIADLLLACFTNLERVIKMKCHHHAIEKRGDNIRIAAQLLGKSKNILKILKARQLPDIDQDLMAYIDKWRALPMSQLSNGVHNHILNDGASSGGVQRGPPSFNVSHIVSIM
ncbi:hypothetical protein HanPSC8_Chr11g0498751 [Helianthus annuus]|nr:hypothetical protein HanIR_Chr11g0556341 [Helianthus annuus]KAJ0687432.1 hypothetical protein HanLR1_Chr11g0425991 [Helianthus annuus]KAJ0877322.1 hypothetical protein HanPSC8_Chr11g0498751 [Helianthus annuus]